MDIAGDTLPHMRFTALLRLSHAKIGAIIDPFTGTEIPAPQVLMGERRVKKRPER